MSWNMLVSVYQSSARRGRLGRSRGRLVGWVPPQPKSLPYERVDGAYRRPRPWEAPDDATPWETKPFDEPWERPTKRRKREGKAAPTRKPEQKAKPVEEPVEQEDIDTERFKRIERKPQCRARR